VPQSWRDQFDQSLVRFLATGGGGREGMSLDALIEEMPLEGGYLVTPDMDDLHRAAMLAIVRRLIPFISNDLENGAPLCESPPELAMLYAIALVAWEWTDGVLVRDQFGAGGLIATRGVFLEVQPQAHIGNYRVDFLLTMALRDRGKTVSSAQMVVECDGHDFHDRTKEQASRDRARDRELQAVDLPIFRYTGSDVWRDVFAAAYQAVEELARRMPPFRPPIGCGSPLSIAPRTLSQPPTGHPARGSNRGTSRRTHFGSCWVTLIPDGSPLVIALAARLERDHRRVSRFVHAVRGSIGWLRYAREPGLRRFVANSRLRSGRSSINVRFCARRVRPSFGLGPCGGARR
jgi:very-short-patch-repair endonuclease